MFARLTAHLTRKATRHKAPRETRTKNEFQFIATLLELKDESCRVKGSATTFLHPRVDFSSHVIN